MKKNAKTMREHFEFLNHKKKITRLGSIKKRARLKKSCSSQSGGDFQAGTAKLCCATKQTTRGTSGYRGTEKKKGEGCQRNKRTRPQTPYIPWSILWGEAEKKVRNGGRAGSPWKSRARPTGGNVACLAIGILVSKTWWRSEKGSGFKMEHPDTRARADIKARRRWGSERPKRGNTIRKP